jgi:hypothetical protein
MQVVSSAHNGSSEMGNVKGRCYCVSVLHHEPLLLFVCRVVEYTQYVTIWMLLQVSSLVEKVISYDR